MFEWMQQNSEWFFSGIWIFLIGLIVEFLRRKKNKNPYATSESTVSLKGEMNISGNVAGGDIIIKNSVEKVKTSELISILKIRSKQINRDLDKFYKYPNVSLYLKQFNKFHKQHIRALKKGDLVLAHEILIRIYLLSEQLELTEYQYLRGELNVHYHSAPKIDKNGLIIVLYTSGESVRSKELINSKLFFNKSADMLARKYNSIRKGNLGPANNGLHEDI